MDILTSGLLLSAVGVVVVFLMSSTRQSRQQDTFKHKSLSRNANRAARQQKELHLDEQTRFVDSPKRKPYRLLNDAEQNLYHRLREAMPNMQIFTQIGVAQLAQLRGRLEAQALASMAGRGVDFVVCDAHFAIIAAIELAWPSNSEDTKCPEEEKRKALQRLGIPLIVFRPNNLPDADVISREIADAIVRRNRLEADRLKAA
ncbi:MAG: hypothetical protein H6R14_1277 [Proteobacteria bacterium]|nr:hypothetical protein [Pseudomonadota bacterium]